MRLFEHLVYIIIEVRANCSESMITDESHVTMCSCRHTNRLALPSYLVNANSLISPCHIFSAGSSGLFVTSPEEGDLFSAKPTSQKKPVRAAMMHRRKLSVLICWSYVYIQLATLLSSLLSLSLLFSSSLPVSYLPSLSPTYFPSSLPVSCLPSLSPTYFPSSLYLLPSLPSLCLYMYLSYFSSTFLPPPCSRK